MLLASLWLSFALTLGCHLSPSLDGFEYSHWVLPLDQPNQQITLNTLGQQGWLECFPFGGDVYCSRPIPWSTQIEWKSWELPKRSSVDAALTEAGAGNYDQCFIYANKRLWCSRPISVGAP